MTITGICFLSYFQTVLDTFTKTTSMGIWFLEHVKVLYNLHMSMTTLESEFQQHGPTARRIATEI